MAEWLQILSLILSGVSFTIFCTLATIVVNKANANLKAKAEYKQKHLK